MKESTYSHSREIVSTVKKSAASMLAACAPQERTPGQPRTVAGRAESPVAQDLRDDRRGDGDGEPVQLARDPLVTPARVFE